MINLKNVELFPHTSTIANQESDNIKKIGVQTTFKTSTRESFYTPLRSGLHLVFKNPSTIGILYTILSNAVEFRTIKRNLSKYFTNHAIDNAFNDLKTNGYSFTIYTSRESGSGKEALFFVADKKFTLEEIIYCVVNTRLKIISFDGVDEKELPMSLEEIKKLQMQAKEETGSFQIAGLKDYQYLSTNNLTDTENTPVIKAAAPAPIIAEVVKPVFKRSETASQAIQEEFLMPLDIPEEIEAPYYEEYQVEPVNMRLASSIYTEDDFSIEETFNNNTAFIRRTVESLAPEKAMKVTQYANEEKFTFDIPFQSEETVSDIEEIEAKLKKCGEEAAEIENLLGFKISEAAEKSDIFIPQNEKQNSFSIAAKTAIQSLMDKYTKNGEMTKWLFYRVIKDVESRLDISYIKTSVYKYLVGVFSNVMNNKNERDHQKLILKSIRETEAQLIRELNVAKAKRAPLFDWLAIREG